MSSVIKLAVLVMYITATATAASYLDDFVPAGYKDKILDAGRFRRHKRSNVFSGHDPEGEEVLNRLNSIMSNSSISERSKQMLEAAIGNIGNSGARSSPDAPAGRSAVPAGTFRSSGGPSFSRSSLMLSSFSIAEPLLKSKSSQTLHATQCCCKVEMPPLTERRSYQVTRHRYFYRMAHSGYRSCGFWGWKRCARYTPVMDSHPYTATQYYTAYIQQSCPTKKEVCCRGYVAYKRCCTNIRELKRLLDLFISQRDQFESLRMFLISQGHNPDKGCPLSCGP